MKKILKFFVLFLVLVVCCAMIILLYPCITQRHNFDTYNISFECPKYFEKIEENEKLTVFKSKRSSISIQVYDFDKGFLDETDITEKLIDYGGLLKAVNYEAVVENNNDEVVLISDVICGKHTAEIKTVKQLNKETTIIIPDENNDVIISIYGLKDDMNKNEKVIKNIFESIKIK